MQRSIPLALSFLAFATVAFATVAFANLAFAKLAFADKPAERPGTGFFGFLEAGIRVGIKSTEGSQDVSLLVLDEEEYAAALDIFRARGGFVDAMPLAKRHAIVRKQLDAYLAAAEKEASDQANEIRVYPLKGTFVGTIRSLGEDFVAIEYLQLRHLDEEQVQIVINKSTVARIYPNWDPIRFTPL